MLISLFFFVLVEVAALFSGIGWRFSEYVNPDKTDWLIRGGSIACSIFLGLICGWLAIRAVNKAPNFLWVWGGGIIGALLGWAVTGQLLHLQPSLILSITPVVSGIGGIIGVVVSGRVGGARPGQRQPSQKQTRQPQQPPQPQMAMANYGPGPGPMPAPGYGGPQQMGGPPPQMMGGPQPQPGQDPEIEIKRLRKRLYQEAVQMAQNPTSVSQSVAGTRWPEPQLFVVDPAHVALVVVIPCYLGQLTFFVVCPVGYPEKAPVEVHIELLRQGNPPVQLNYDGRRLSTWKTGSNLAGIFKDGFLQIEETVLG
jgi:hypothetical protein